MGQMFLLHVVWVELYVLCLRVQRLLQFACDFSVIDNFHLDWTLFCFHTRSRVNTAVQYITHHCFLDHV